jgi:maltooligosyltrehalose trehalohydrolase
MLYDLAGNSRPLVMTSLPEGWFELVTAEARAGSRYRYRIDGKTEVPDPVSRRNP